LTLFRSFPFFSLRSTALGSALLAASAVGLFGWDVNDPKTLEKVNAKGKQVFTSEIDDQKRTKMLAGWEKAVTRARGWNEQDNEGESK